MWKNRHNIIIPCQTEVQCSGTGTADPPWQSTRFKIKKPAASYFPAFSSIIGAEVLDFRVRNGNGYCHLAMATGIDCLFSRAGCLRGYCPGRRLAHAL